MDYMAELSAIAQEHGGITEIKTAIVHGISKAMLYNLCKEKISQSHSGAVYFFDNMQDELLSIRKRSNQVILSHKTALFLHGILGQTSFEHTITVPSDRTVSAAIKNECLSITKKCDSPYFSSWEHINAAAYKIDTFLCDP